MAGTPIVANYVSLPRLSSPDLYPTFSRVFPTDGSDANAHKLILQLLKESLDVSYLTCIYIRDAYGSSYHSNLLLEANNQNIDILATESYEPSATKEDIRKMVKSLKERDVRYILCISYGPSSIVILEEAAKIGLVGN